MSHDQFFSWDTNPLLFLTQPENSATSTHVLVILVSALCFPA